MPESTHESRVRTPLRGVISTCLLVLCASSLLPSAARASGILGEGESLAPKEAQARLAQARSLLRKKKATNEELRSALDELAKAHARFGGSARETATFRRKAEAQLLKGLALFGSDRRAPDVNRRADINVLAATRLAGTSAVLTPKERRSLSRKIRGVIEEIATKRDPDQWQQETLNHAYDALAALNDHDTLRWMLAEHRHTKDREIPFLIAAHRAMVKFREVPGALRYEICDRMLTAYGGTELVARKASAAAADRAKKRFWDEMERPVVSLLQHFAGAPEDEEGRAYGTLQALARWWRDHDDVRKAPWR